MAPLLGWLALLCLPVAVLSGVLLGWHYVPSASAAHASLVELETLIPGGVFLRSLHALSSHVALALGLLHLVAVLIRGESGAAAGRRAFATGLWSVALVGLVAFTGRALPWDQHGGLSLQVADRFLAAGELRPLRGLLGALAGPLLLQRVLLLHLGLSAAALLLLALHLPLRARLREWAASPLAGRRVIGVASGALLLLLLGALLHRPALGEPFVAGAELALGQSAEWYLRWLQLLSLRAGALAPAAAGLLVLLAVATPLLDRWIGRRWLRVLWASLLSALALLSLLPAG